jgi:hypothetical protein
MESDQLRRENIKAKSKDRSLRQLLQVPRALQIPGLHQPM